MKGDFKKCHLRGKKQRLKPETSSHSRYPTVDLLKNVPDFSNSSIRDPTLSTMPGYKHPPLYLSGSGRASQETAVSCFCQQALPGICNIVWFWWLYMEWIPRWDSFWMAFPSVSAPYFVSILPPVSILFPLLRSTEASTLWSSFFLNFIWSVSCILDIPNFLG